MKNKRSNAGSVPSTYCKDEIVISGIAGRFPDSDNINRFKENLMNKVDLVSDDDRRWKLDNLDIPQRAGKINNLEKFDATFFGIDFNEAQTMDPMGRMLLEHAYEAIVDAGVNPQQLRGTKTGVFIGACISESEKIWLYETLQVDGFGIPGCSRAMLANRISCWLGIKGPSYAVDTACSSSLAAMENAYSAIRTGLCDAALVGAVNLCLHPYVSLQHSRLGVLSPDGRCKTFDADANGYARSEAIGLVYLQKAKDAKRIYATFVHGKVNCDGFKDEGITFPSSLMQSTLLKEFYEECGLPPSVLNYVEAHGTGTTVGDPEEVNAIDRVCCPGRTTPLRIGSVKSNIGHSEPASGICSIAKVVIAMECGIIPPNLHYNRPREGVKALEDGRIKVISEVTPWEGGYVGINSFGFGGVNAHILLKSNSKEKINCGAPNDDLPRLVVASGRTHEAADSILNDVESRPVDAEYSRLLHDIHSDDIPGHRYRGYTIVGGSATQDNPIREIQHYPGAKRPVWFVFSGMGSQWAGMGTALLRFPVFAEAIKKCDAVLKPRGVDIYDILTNKDKSIFDNILNSFVGITAVQIGIVDLLNYVGILPDKILGHSVGELGCAYADGCFTVEQTVLAAYFRGLASIETDTIRGSMASVSLGYEDLKNLCPSDIEVACHDGPKSSTICGPAESMKSFVAQLKARYISACEIPCSNVASHSRYIAKAGSKLSAYLQQVIPQPKRRSPKWVSTSMRHIEWDAAAARLSSAEYHTNNLLSPVLFEESLLLIPEDAVTIEIAPHGILQAILRRSLHPEVTNIGLTQRGHRDNVEVFLQGLGKLFSVGLNPQLAKLYPDIEFPVSRGTPMISPLVKWEHTDDWYVTSYRTQDKIESGERIVEVTLADEDYEYMAGHVIDGRNLLPATGYLTLVWETVGMMRGEMYNEVSVVFENVKFLRATTIPKEGSVELTLMIQKGTGRFEIVEGGAAVVTGIVRQSSKPDLEMMTLHIPNDDDVIEEMSSKDVYKDLKLRGCNYSGMFRGIKSSTVDATKGTLAWKNNWVGFMESMLQMSIVSIDSRGLFVPTGIQKLTIDTKSHLNALRASTTEEKQLIVRRYPEYDVIISGGIEIRGLKTSSISRRRHAEEPVLETFQFVAHRDNAEISLKDFLTISVHITQENTCAIKMKTVEAINETAVPALENLVSPYLVRIFRDMPLIQADINIVAPENSFADPGALQNITIEDPKKLNTDTGVLIVSGRGLFSNSNSVMLKKLLLSLRSEGFLIALETENTADIYALAAKNSLDIVLEKRVKNETALLLRKRDKFSNKTTIINVASNTFEWLPPVKLALKEAAEASVSNTKKIILVSEKDFENGLLGLVQCFRKEPGGDVVRGYLIQDKNAPDFSMDNSLYADQLKLDLAFNVLRANGTWGTYRHLHLAEIVEKPMYHAWANQLIRGDLSSFRWLEGPLHPSSNRKDLVRVVYAPINFRDVMVATGKLAVEVVAKNRYQEECPFGLEFSGVDTSGRRVMGTLRSRGFTNIVEMDTILTWTVPDYWSLEDAATIPCAYATCYYALYYKAEMKKGDKVLIHAGTGSVGQAAINLALHEGCEVFTTVGTPDKRRFIRETFPQIDDDHIGNSRDTSFEQMVTKQTKGRGVDIVLNSFAEEKLQASIRCLATGGRFLEIGKFDIAANNPLRMEVFLKDIIFCGVMLDNLLAASPEKKNAIRSLMQRGLDSGAVKPLTRKVFPKEEMESAFRYMAAANHIGKVLIAINRHNGKLDTPIKALPRFHCPEDRSYVILGGLGGFGLELANWLVLRGAKNIVLTSRSGIKNGYQSKRISLWKSYGTKVIVIAGKEAHNREDCEYILKTAAKLGPVDGIFNLVVILIDALVENQTESNFEEIFRGKSWGTKQLDRVSRKLCPKLEHFVVFSSTVSGRGNPGQTNYGMSNSAMERICEKRVAEGLPALAIQWGFVGDVGLVVDMLDNQKNVIMGGFFPQNIASCLEVLDKFLMQRAPIVASMVVAEKQVDDSGALNVVDTVYKIMGLKDPKAVSANTSLTELGMDSMMAIEIKQTLEREFGIFLNPRDIRTLNSSKLLDMSAKEATKNDPKDKSAVIEESLTGMKMFAQLLEEREFIQKDCLKMHTKEEAGRDEVFLIPGIEGYRSVFNKLADKIRSPATCLQLLHNAKSKTTIPEMAEQFVPHILQRNENRRDFVIVGYSYGSVVAIELARKLEAKGLTGRLVLIDGSPEFMKNIKNQEFSTDNDDQLQNNILLGVMDVLSPATSPDLVVALEKCTTWSEKLNVFMSLTPTESATNIAHAEQKSLFTAIFHRLAALQWYEYADLPPLRSSIVLLKPSAATLKTVSPDYGLGKLTREKVKIVTVEGNHASILDDTKIATVINDEPIQDDEAFKGTIVENREILTSIGDSQHKRP